VTDPSHAEAHPPGESAADDRARTLRITYEVDGAVVRVVEKQVSQRYVWFLIGNSSWREW
jgi:hypothetical protein